MAALCEFSAHGTEWRVGQPTGGEQLPFFGDDPYRVAQSAPKVDRLDQAGAYDCGCDRRGPRCVSVSQQEIPSGGMTEEQRALGFSQSVLALTFITVAGPVRS